MTVFSFLNFTLTNGNLPPITPLLGLAVRGANIPPGTSVSLYSAEQALPPWAARRTTPTLDLSASLALLVGAIQSPFVSQDSITPYPIARRDMSFAGTQLALNAASSVPFFGSADAVPQRPRGRLLEAYTGFNPANFPSAATPFFGLTDVLRWPQRGLLYDTTRGILPSSVAAATPFFGLASDLPRRRARFTPERQYNPNPRPKNIQFAYLLLASI